MIGVRAGFVVLVASQAGEHTKIRCIRMALTAGGPFSTVFPAVYREMLAVVVEGTWLPGYIGVASLTFGRESSLGMHRFRRGGEILLVAIVASRGGAHITLGMALVAGQTQVSALERKTGGLVVIEGRRLPIHPIVAHLTILGELCRRMCRIRRCRVILQMTRNAFGTHWIEPQLRTRFMASVAVHPGMPALQREPRLPVDLRDVAHHPGS